VPQGNLHHDALTNHLPSTSTTLFQNMFGHGHDNVNHHLVNQNHYQNLHSSANLIDATSSDVTVAAPMVSRSQLAQRLAVIQVRVMLSKNALRLVVIQVVVIQVRVVLMFK
jgi:hypothetical protein